MFLAPYPAAGSATATIPVVTILPGFSLSLSESLVRLCKTSVNSCPTISLAVNVSSDRIVDNSSVNNSNTEQQRDIITTKDRCIAK